MGFYIDPTDPEAMAKLPEETRRRVRSAFARVLLGKTLDNAMDADAAVASAATKGAQDNGDVA